MGIFNWLWDAPDAPDTPDFVGQANAEAEAGRDLATQQTYANRPRQVTPFGTTDFSQELGYDPSTGLPITNWTQTETLTPELQSALDAQLKLTQGRSELGAGMMGRLNDEIGTPLDWNQFGDSTGLEFNPDELRQQATDAAYAHSTSRLDPRFAQERERMEIQMRNQGLRPGSEAYDRAMGNFGRDKNDAYEQATHQAFLAGQGESGQLFNQQTGAADYANNRRQADIADTLRERGTSLNEVNALISGQQVNNPSMPNFKSASTSAPPALLDATQMGYQGDLDSFNAGQGASQGMMGGLASLGKAASGFIGP